MSANELVQQLDENNTRSLIKPTDSDYVRYAKQGGDRDLLVAHDIEKSNVAKPYSKCDWFDHIHNDDEDAVNRKTSNQIENQKVQSAADCGLSARQEGSKIKEKYTTGGVPFHTDNMSVWERKEKQPETPEERKRRQAARPF